MALPHSPQSTDRDQSNDLNEQDAILLERVAEKLVRFGPQAGVTPESVAVFLTDAHAKVTYPDGKSEDIDAKAGSVQHMMPLPICRKTPARSLSKSSKLS